MAKRRTLDDRGDPSARAGDRALADDVAAASDANAVILARLLEARTRFREDPDYATLAQRWDDATRGIVDDGVAGIGNAGLRARVRREALAVLARESGSIHHQVMRGAAEAHAAWRHQYLESLLRHVGPGADDALTSAAIDAYHATIDAAVARGYLTPEAALAEKRAAALALCAAHYAATVRADPVRAIAELADGMAAHPVAEFLSPDARDTLIARARANEAARRLDAQRAPFILARQAQHASDAAEADIAKNLSGPDPTVTATAIVNSDVLSPAAKERMLAFAARAANPDPPAAISAANTAALLDRIQRPATDPESIRDMAPIIAAYTAGDLGAGDFVLAADCLADIRRESARPCSVTNPGTRSP
jgi:hypothetical protein